MLIPILDDDNLRDDTNNLVLPQEIVIKDTVENNGRENDEILFNHSGKSAKVLQKSKAKSELKIACKYCFTPSMCATYFLLSFYSTKS